MKQINQQDLFAAIDGVDLDELIKSCDRAFWRKIALDKARTIHKDFDELPTWEGNR